MEYPCAALVGGGGVGVEPIFGRTPAGATPIRTASRTQQGERKGGLIVLWKRCKALSNFYY